MRNMQLKNKIILFGAGFYGKKAYLRFRESRELVCMIDSFPERVDASWFGIPVYGFEELTRCYAEDMDIIICSRHYLSMGEQLFAVGIESFYVMMEGFLYHTGRNETMMPVELEEYPYYKRSDDKKTILFVQNAACIRTHKEAMLMKNDGHHVCLLYTLIPPVNEYEEYRDNYEHIWGFTSVNGIVDFINHSDFDVIHCSNEPDILAVALRDTNKPLIFDTHDMQSVRGKLDIEGLVLEHLANTYSDGVMYPSEGLRRIAQEKYNLRDKEIYVLENLPFDQMEMSDKLTKLSKKDGEIHCVYEGGITGENRLSHRYFQNIWLLIANSGVHVHFYSAQEQEYCNSLESLSPYLHYEGNVGGKRLIYELTQYDLGLLLFNSTSQSQLQIEIASPNKMYEYLNAGLPLLVGKVQSHMEFIDQFHVGLCLDLSEDIRRQLSEAIKIQVPENFLREHMFTLTTRQKDLTKFYEQVANRTNSCG